jgi:hypothetical protein
MLDTLSPSINEPTDGEAYQPVLDGWSDMGEYLEREY